MVLVMVVSPTAEVAAFLIHAIREHRARYRANGAPPPAGLEDLVAALGSSVKQRQPAPTPAAAAAAEQVEPVPVRLLTYSAAAAVLAISPRSLDRRIAAGDLHPVKVGGANRLRVAEIDDYVAALAAKGRQ